MNIYYIYNDDHQILLNKYFLPSIDKYNNFLIPIGEKFNNNIKNVEFGTLDFKRLMLDKINYIIHLISNNSNPFIISDTDIEFFDSIKIDITNSLFSKPDIVFQQEGYMNGANAGINTGFMLISPNNKVLDFWQDIKIKMNSYKKNEFINEQLIANENKQSLKYKCFNKKIWNWTIDNTIPIYKIKLHHANCAKNVDEKLDKLNLFRDMRKKNQWYSDLFKKST